MSPSKATKIAGAALLWAGLAGHALAAPVTWSGAVSIGGDASSLASPPNSSIFSAVNFSGGAPGSAVVDDRGAGFVSPATTTTTSGVTFNTIGTAGAGATVAVTTGRNNDSNVSNVYGVGTNYTSDAGFNQVLNSAIYSLAGSNPVLAVTLTGLAAGQTYTVQLFAVRENTIPAGIVQTYEGGGNTSGTLSTATNSYIMGVFTADATTQLINVTGSGGVALLSALVVRRVVPEIDAPQAMLPLALLGMMLLAYRDRRRACAALS